MVHTPIHSIYINCDCFYSNFVYLIFWKVLSKFRYTDITNILEVTNSRQTLQIVKAVYLFPYLSSRDQLSNASSLRERNNIQTCTPNPKNATEYPWFQQLQNFLESQPVDASRKRGRSHSRFHRATEISTEVLTYTSRMAAECIWAVVMGI